MKKDQVSVRSRRFLSLGIALTAIVAAACSDAAPTAPAARTIEPSADAALARARSLADLLPDAHIAQGLLRTKPLAHNVVVTKVIKHDGGKIDVPDADFTLVIPKGAFAGDTMTFSVVALAGSTVAYDFEPHGAKFAVPLTFKQKLGHTNLKGLRLPPGLSPSINGAYFTDASMVDRTTGIAVVSELLPADIIGTWLGDEFTFPIHHFSGYMASTGRSGF